MSLLNELDKRFNKLNEQKEEVHEVNTTSNVDGYDSPNAFSKSGKVDPHNNVEQFGMKKVKKKKKDYVYASPEPAMEDIDESEYKRLSRSLFLSEASYNQYKSTNPKIKINTALHEISRKLHEVEKVISHAARLKTEMGIDSDAYWKSSQDRIVRISEKLINIVNQFKGLKG